RARTRVARSHTARTVRGGQAGGRLDTGTDGPRRVARAALGGDPVPGSHAREGQEQDRPDPCRLRLSVPRSMPQDHRARLSWTMACMIMETTGAFPAHTWIEAS